MQKKKRFKGTSRPRQFYDRKVQTPGHTRALSIGKIIPKGWQYVRIWPLTKTNTKIVIEIEKLLGEEHNAQTKTTDKGREQNT